MHQRPALHLRHLRSQRPSSRRRSRRRRPAAQASADTLRARARTTTNENSSTIVCLSTNLPTSLSKQPLSRIERATQNASRSRTRECKHCPRIALSRPGRGETIESKSNHCRAPRQRRSPSGSWLRTKTSGPPTAPTQPTRRAERASPHQRARSRTPRPFARRSPRRLATQRARPRRRTAPLTPGASASRACAPRRSPQRSS